MVLKKEAFGRIGNLKKYLFIFSYHEVETVSESYMKMYVIYPVFILLLSDFFS